MKWYVVHTYASHENRVKETIDKGKLGTALETRIGQILIPTQKTFHIRDGKKIEREKKLFNSYIIMEAELDPEVIGFVTNIAGVTNFLGDGKRPVPLTDSEVNRLLGIADRDKDDVHNYEYLPGDMVKIIAGPFTDFDGVIEKVSDGGAKLVVNVSVFGRSTPVEVNTDQAEKK